ncbi:MAG: AraC family transcriptional regulator [Longicatena sp.]
MEWLKNLSDAITYIEDHLDSDISIQEIAHIANCSTYYFQRIFTYVAGISLAEYIRRRRMSQAAFDLQRGEMKVLEVAMKYGYSSPTAFHRAFHAVHGISPSNAKLKCAILNVYPPIRFTVEVSGGKALSYHIETKEAMRIVGIRTSLVDNMEENHRQVPLFWKHTLQAHVIERLEQITNKEQKQVLGVSVYENTNDMHYYIAVETSEQPPEGMYIYEIPAATWVVFENEGSYKESVQSIFQRFYKEWLLCSGYEYAGFPDIEVYPMKEHNTKQGHSEVWIAIKKMKEEIECII